MTTPPKSTLTMISLDTANADAKSLLESAQAKMGMVPNMYGYMANFPALLETYGVGYDLFRTKSGFTPVEQEVVFLSISYQNACDYCMAAHSFVADNASKVPFDVTDAIRAGRPIEDARLEALSTTAKAIVAGRGYVDADTLKVFLGAGYGETQYLALLLAVSVKTISNYANHYFRTPVDQVFSGRAWIAPAAAE